jgi:hypothetical protein
MANILPSFDGTIPNGDVPVRWPVTGGVLEVAQASPPGTIDAIAAICELGDLQANWDSYGAQPIDKQCMVTAILLLLTTSRPKTPPPSVVPTVRGGVQLEWHRGGIDLEIEVLSPSQIRVSWEDARTGQMTEQTLAGDFAPAVAAIEKLSAAM